ncbi:MAG: hypothetical protein PHG48_01325 [Eubacteriales bacterium]|nr:hypothetical protein [Eubacteriales bacterium]
MSGGWPEKGNEQKALSIIDRGLATDRGDFTGLLALAFPGNIPYNRCPGDVLRDFLFYGG